MKVNKHRKKIAAALAVGLALSPVSEDLFAFTASSTPACVSAAKARTKKAGVRLGAGKRDIIKRESMSQGFRKSVKSIIILIRKEL